MPETPAARGVGIVLWPRPPLNDALLAQLLDADPTLLCVSAWNDHGQRGRASNATALYRTDLASGLGWMLRRDTGLELYPQWPKQVGRGDRARARAPMRAAAMPPWRHGSGYEGAAARDAPTRSAPQFWDDWLRSPAVRDGRQCVFPEVPRTHTFGSIGTSGGIFYRSFLANMLLNRERIDWARMVRTWGQGSQLCACGWADADCGCKRATVIAGERAHTHARTHAHTHTHAHSHACARARLPAQDLSYLRAGAYAALMDGWLAAAVPLVLPPSIELRDHCGARQPAEKDMRDLYLNYSSSKGFMALARELHPMLPDLRVRCVCVCV